MSVKESTPKPRVRESTFIHKDKYSCAVESDKFLKFSEEVKAQKPGSRFDKVAGWRTQSHFQGAACHVQTPNGSPPSSAPVPPGIFDNRTARANVTRGVPTYVTRNNWAAMGEGQFQRNSRLYIPGQGYAHGDY